MAVDIQGLKQSAAGRWPEILIDLGGMDHELLDGQHHPCPQCGGKDRFRCIDPAEGALLCNQCFNQKNGDGIAALGWLHGWSLPETLAHLAEHLGLQNGGPRPAPVTKTSKSSGFNGVSDTAPSKKPPPKIHPTMAAAVDALARQVGAKPTAVWPYHNAQGDEIAAAVRFDLADGKTFRSVSRNGSGWVARGPGQPRLLYRLPELADAQRVYVCEGEKAADVGRSVGLTCTTSPNGARSPRKADWAPLAGKDVILCPDCDSPGEEYIEAVAALLGKLEPAPRVRVLRLPGLVDGGDLADFVEAHDAVEPEALAERINTLADEAPAWQPPKPTGKAAKPNISQWRPFPVECLPEPVAGFVRAGAKAIGCDPTYIAVPLLAGLGSAIGNARRIGLKRGWVEPPIIWACVVAESGTQKSPAMELALRPIRARQRIAMREYQKQAATHQTESLYYEKELAAWKRSKTGGDPPEKPDEPVAGRAWTDDATLEALAMLLQQNPRGLLCARDELSGWLNGFDRYSNGKGGDAAKWLEVWGGRSIIFDRKTGNPRTIFVPRASVCLAGCIQPGPLRRALGAEHIENGLAARLLLAAPPRVPKRWTESDIDRATEAAMEGLFSNLYGLESAMVDDEPEPVVLRLDSGAKAAWVRYYNEHAREANGLSGELAAVAAKLEAYAARLALVVHLVRYAAGDGTADRDSIDAASMVAGVALSRWFGHEARRVYHMLHETDEGAALRELVESIQRLGGATTANDLRRRSRMFATNEEAEAVLTDLVARELGAWEWASPGEAGGRPSRVFRLNVGESVS